MNVASALGGIVAHLERSAIDYMLVGSFASSFHGSMRSTRDIDLVIEANPDQLRGLVQNLQTAGYYAELDAALDAHRNGSMFNVIDSATGWKIDLIFRKSREFDREEFRRRQPVKLFDIELFVASAEDVIISKLEWAKLGGSQRQIEDVARLLVVHRDALDQNYLHLWIGSLELHEQWENAKAMADISS
jgi:hypothetical protein